MKYKCVCNFDAGQGQEFVAGQEFVGDDSLVESLLKEGLIESVSDSEVVSEPSLESSGEASEEVGGSDEEEIEKPKKSSKQKRK